MSKFYGCDAGCGPAYHCEDCESVRRRPCACPNECQLVGFVEKGCTYTPPRKPVKPCPKPICTPDCDFEPEFCKPCREPEFKPYVKCYKVCAPACRRPAPCIDLVGNLRRNICGIFREIDLAISCPVPPPPKPKLHCETVYKKCSYYKPERKYHWTCEYPCACHCKEPRC